MKLDEHSWWQAYRVWHLEGALLVVISSNPD